MKAPGIGLALALLLAVSAAHAARQSALRSPEPGVVCDRYLCANDQGVSRALTEKHIGLKAATRLSAQGEFDPTQWSFANGIFCDTKERLCRQHRYYGTDGKRSGAVNKKYTRLLFGG